MRIEKTDYWIKMETDSGYVQVLRNQPIQLTVETEHHDAYIDLSDTEARKLRDILNVVLEEADESVL